jgi:hypothetical protein
MTDRIEEAAKAMFAWEHSSRVWSDATQREKDVWLTRAQMGLEAVASRDEPLRIAVKDIVNEWETSSFERAGTLHRLLENLRAALAAPLHQETEPAEVTDAKEQMRQRLVVCDMSDTPHSYAICSCTDGHTNSRLAPAGAERGGGVTVKRWEYAGDIEGNPPEGFEGMLSSPDGDYVKFTDYAALEREAVALRDAVERYEARCHPYSGMEADSDGKRLWQKVLSAQASSLPEGEK